MSTTFFPTPTTLQLPLESLPEYADVCLRFLQGFENFITRKKYESVVTILSQEFSPLEIVKSESLRKAVAQKLGNDCFHERRFVFLSVYRNNRPKR